jgi:hypothetical protein
MAGTGNDAVPHAGPAGQRASSGQDPAQIVRRFWRSPAGTCSTETRLGGVEIGQNVF